MTIPLTTYTGDIAKYGLEVFWEGLDESERGQIRAVYGNIDSGEPRAEDELAGMFLFKVARRCADFGSSRSAGWKCWREGFRRVEFAAELNSDLIHEVYSTRIKLGYADRHFLPGVAEETDFLAEVHVSMGPKIVLDMIRENPSIEALPSHQGYEKAAMMCEEDEEYDKAIYLCETARNFGWDGDWENMITRNELKRDVR